ncbi:hypothetical protein IT411_01860, partial [Candidatus Peregrinibacteria bacterium]|nr:hypothetical protein [Candidatus Peregrinibacteria bacterium]
MFISALFATTVPAASPTTWVATTSTGCSSQFSPHSSAEVNGLIYTVNGGSSFQSYNTATGNCTTLSSSSISIHSLIKISDTELLGVSSTSRMPAVYNIPCNTWVSFFPRMIDRSANACPNAQAGGNQGVGNSITEYQGELYTLV